MEKVKLGRSIRNVAILWPGSELLYLLTKTGTYWNYKYTCKWVKSNTNFLLSYSNGALLEGDVAT